MLILGDARNIPLQDNSVHCVVTSPPYMNLRDYKVAGQIGLEESSENYIAALVDVFREVKRVLRPDGTCWLNLGDSYNGSSNDGKPKDLMMIPARVALALQADGWWLRSDIIWSKPNPMPESVTDRPTKSHEYIFLLSKSAKYYYDAEAIKEPLAQASIERYRSGWHGNENRDYAHGQQNHLSKYMGSDQAKCETTRNARSVWTIPTQPYRGAHFAVFPTEIPRRCILAGTSERGVCSICGAPYKRITQINRSGKALQLSGKNGELYLDGTHGSGDVKTWNQLGADIVRESITTGWRASCTCNAGEPVPAIVLDPFSGSGTTVSVALSLGRRGIGIDLSEKYMELARQRSLFMTQ